MMECQSFFRIFSDFIVCGNSSDNHGMTFTSSCGDVWGVCNKCRSNARIGSSVRNMGYGCGLLKRDDGYAVVNLVKVCNMSGVKSTPEDALRAAGLMEEEI